MLDHSSMPCRVVDSDYVLMLLHCTPAEKPQPQGI